MNWISFKEQRPKEEPVRQIWCHWLADGKDYYTADHSDNVFINIQPLEWAEIEPPPKPDPFEEAWVKHAARGPLRFEDHFQAGWDAAMKYKEGQK